MMRIQIQLEREQHRRLRKRARDLGVSISELVRRSVDAEQPAAGREELARRALAVVGKYEDPHGASNVAIDHDAALADAYRQ